MLDAGLRLDAPPLIPCSTAVRRAPPPPNFQTKVRHHRNRASAVRNRVLLSKSRKIGGMSAPGARTIFRLSLRECQRDIGGKYSRRTPSAREGRARAAGRRGSGVVNPFLRGEPLRVQGVLCRRRRVRCSVGARQSMRGGYTRLGVTRHRADTARGGRGRGGKDDLCEIIALSPFGRL